MLKGELQLLYLISCPASFSSNSALKHIPLDELNTETKGGKETAVAEGPQGDGQDQLRAWQPGNVLAFV